MSKKINWHRAFGLTLTDFFKDSNFEVGLEKEMSVKLQYLDVLIIKKSDGKPIDKLKLPDGFEHLANYNILTYKSMHQALDHWAIEEVIGHYVSYRKIVSPSKQELLPASDFQIYAVSTRYPQNLLGSKKKPNPEIEEIQAGVYKVSSQLICPVIILVLSEMLKDDKNALWQLFSGKADGFAVRRPAGGSLIHGRFRQAAQIFAVEVRHVKVRAAALGEDHGHPATIGRGGGRHVRAAVTGHELSFAGAELVGEDVRVASQVAGVEESVLPRHPAGGCHR
jgi:hypothetical protein